MSMFEIKGMDVCTEGERQCVLYDSGKPGGKIMGECHKCQFYSTVLGEYESDFLASNLK